MRATLAPLAAVVLVLAGPAAASPGEMSVATFLAKVDALKAKGFGAMFSPDVGVLREEATAAGMVYKARLDQERVAGRPSSCPPKPVNIGQGLWLDHLRAYPAAQRGAISLNRAMAELFIKTWPCKK